MVIGVFWNAELVAEKLLPNAYRGALRQSQISELFSRIRASALKRHAILTSNMNPNEDTGMDLGYGTRWPKL